MNALELSGVTKRYDAFTLDHISLSLPNGSIMGLIGENGAGKTTTIRLSLGMLAPDEGSIRVFGQDCRDIYPRAREEIGVMLDETVFSYAFSAQQVGKIMQGFFRNWDNEEYARLLERLSLPEKKPFKDYSLGMKRKLGLAVALSHHAKLLLLDEPTSGLDPIVRDEVLTLFSDFTREEDHSILISSHIVSDLEKLCDYIAFLHRGRLMLCEEKDRLYEEYGVARCPQEALGAIDPACILGKRETPYGVEALMRRTDIPQGMEVGQVDIEQLFVLMAKEA